MSGVNQDLINEFKIIAGGQVSDEEAIKYLKMGKNNLESALNYYFNKKAKTEKPPEPQKPTNIFQQLQEGSKKQAKVERIIKDLRNEYSKSIMPSSGPSSVKNTPDSLKVTPNPKATLEKLDSFEFKNNSGKTTANKLSETKSVTKSESSFSIEKESPRTDQKIKSLNQNFEKMNNLFNSGNNNSSNQPIKEEPEIEDAMESKSEFSQFVNM